MLYDTAESKTNNDDILAIDLFAGAGGFSLAAINAGIQVLASIEINPKACETYKRNLINGKINPPILFEKDILELDPSVLLQQLPITKNRLDILMGGPPCQGFSEHRTKDSGIDDPRNKLLLRYFDFVQVFKPKLFIVENVPGLLWRRHKDYLDKFMQYGELSGYTVMSPIKLNAKDYGAPQNRSRVFIVGVRKDHELIENVWPPMQTHFSPQKGRNSWLTASTVFEHPPENILHALEGELTFGESLPPSTQDISNIHMNHSEKMIQVFSSTPINGSRHDSIRTLPCHDGNYDGHNDVYGRIRLNRPGPTMTTGCFNPSRGRFLHPWENHGITIRHAARFQTFPDWFQFYGGITAQGAQVGNAVPVKMGEVLLSALKRGIRPIHQNMRQVKK